MYRSKTQGVAPPTEFSKTKNGFSDMVELDLSSEVIQKCIDACVKGGKKLQLVLKSTDEHLMKLIFRGFKRSTLRKVISSRKVNTGQTRFQDK